MAARSLDRLWLLGGVVGAVMLAMIGWLFFISPQYSQAESLRDEAIGEEQRLVTQGRQLAALREQNAKLPQYRSELARARLALPADPNLSPLLRELQQVEAAEGVDVAAFSVGEPSSQTTAGASIQSVPLSLVVVGQMDDVNRFLRQVQEVRPRAVLIMSANIEPIGETIDNQVRLSLSMVVFVGAAAGSAPPAATGAVAGAAAGPAAEEEPVG